MDKSENVDHRIHTGLFEIDPESGEVSREGRVVPLQEQPFRVLMVLLERAGRVVTREELRDRVWPQGTFVGFDEGLNTAIRKLRILFGDSAESPRYIETIPRRGYRFIAPVSSAVERNGSSRVSKINGGSSSAASEADFEPSADPAKNGGGARARGVFLRWESLVLTGGGGPGPWDRAAEAFSQRRYAST